MGITVTGADQVMRRLATLEGEIEKSPKNIFKAISEARNMIEKRTVKGLDYKNNSFTNLSPDYAAYKLSRKNRSTADLLFNGSMLGAMQVEQVTGGGDIFFSQADEEEKAYAHNEGKGQKKREFFRLGKDIEKYLTEQLVKPIRRILK